VTFVFAYDTNIDPSKTALIVMDPWVETLYDKEHDGYLEDITESYILPVIQKAITRKMLIIILTNDSSRIDNTPKIHPGVKKFTLTGQAKLLYHQDYSAESLSNYLRGKGIEILIYTGFASNQCLLKRRSGMPEMKRKGFKVFLIPRASAAVETEDSWESKAIHRDIIKMVEEKGIARILKYDDFIK
ncbi:MAG: isochorismatase family protein, partial [Deltaproteobacteria bacterium]